MITVCYCANKKIFPLILLSVMSIAKHTSQSVTVCVSTMDLSDIHPSFLAISENQRQILEHVLRKKNPDSRAILLDAEQEYRRRLLGGKNEKSFYTPYALTRLLFESFPLPDKLIYLDADVMCCDDLSMLWDIDIEDYEFAAVRDKEGCIFIHRNYCNSGVLLLNLKETRKSGLFERVCKKVCSSKMIMPDQTALNLYAKRKLILPRRFNEQRTIREDTVLKHFCRGFKWYGPFFKLYNYKQDDRNNVHDKLKIFCFDDLYAQYDLLAQQYDFSR